MDEPIIDPFFLAVPTQPGWDDPAAVVAGELAALETCGRTLDGAVLGAPGHVLVLTLADVAEGRLLRWSETAGEPVADVPPAAVGERLGGVVVQDDDGRLVLDGRDVLASGVVAARAGWGGVLVSRKHPGHFDVFAHAVGAPLHAARLGDWTLVGRAAPRADEDVDVTADLLRASPASGRATVLYRLGPTAGVGVAHLDDFEELRLWDGPWRSYEPASTHRLDLREFTASVHDFLEQDVPDGSALVRQHGLDEQGARDLRALLRRPQPDLPAIAGLLGLPAEVVDVVEGRLSVADLPGAVTHPPLRLRELAVRAIGEEPTDPGFWNAVQRASVRMPAWYVAACLVWIAACGAFAWWSLAGDGPSHWGWVALGLGTGELVGLVLRLRAKRRRATRAGQAK